MPGFATIDFETTGLFPGGSDRAIEVAVVHSDPDGTITGRWDTLINPGRDLGRQDIHRITAFEARQAPSFGQIAAELLELLSGRVIVAHNASFDTRFLLAELERMGYSHRDDLVSLCTMRLAKEYLPAGARRSLAECCATFGIELDGAHRASVDAEATALLLAAYLDHTEDRSGWDEYLARGLEHAFARIPSPGAEWFPRERAWESEGYAQPSGRRADAARRRVPAFVDHLAALDRGRPPRGFALGAGDHIALTGSMSRPREEWNAILSGSRLVPRSYVTKQVKVVAAADPDSLSTKARRARAYGIPVVSESALSSLLGL
ncbi:exonuclease domain-containing protein [Herbiconiux ginsengi]|uniref:DNA polymerase-3 subunit epsilon n=1 Tax=Herbiconiux ginsengi TaxID=381665 RepID=A0A1H3T071_9MICO|nr:exonuclease domain-containing protein [Herbiconiux ginsengi]SDZ43430.1 DNA polymerase-3 subunit epsilon [Herbiconiux ginsengi]